MADQQEQYADAPIEAPDDDFELNPQVYEMHVFSIAIDWNWGWLPFFISTFELYMNDFLDVAFWLMDDPLDFCELLVEALRDRPGLLCKFLIAVGFGLGIIWVFCCDFVARR